jgi:flagellar L-ring protein precursor FlgH
MTRIARVAFAAIAVIAASGARADSLYDTGTFRSLTGDAKARAVGDVITIHVLENSSASTSSDTSTSRNTAVEAMAGSSAINGGRPVDGSLRLGSTFEGGGTTQRASRVLATLTVVVQTVLPNGDLCVGGEQVLTVNQEQHKVKVEGRVRPQDITADNVVISTRLADAKVWYAGKGEVSDRHKRGWLRGLIEFLGF